jgi:lipoprotein-releasing system permease protein
MHFMYTWFLTLRYLRRRRIIYFSIAGIAIGILVLIVVTSVMGGFARDMRERIRGVSSHIVIDVQGQTLDRPDRLVALVRGVPGVVAAAPRVEGFAYLDRGGPLRESLVKFVGIDPAREVDGPAGPGTSGLGGFLLDRKAPDFLLDGAPPAHPGAWIGCSLLEPFDAGRPGDPGDDSPFGARGRSFSLLTARREPGARTVQPLHRNFTAVGRFRTRMTEYDSGLVYLSLPAAQAFLGIGDAATHLSVRLEDFGNAKAAARAIRRAFADAPDPEIRRLALSGRFRVLTWEELPGMRILLQAVEAELAIMVVILLFIIMVAGFNVVAIQSLLVDLKTRDIGVLRALGATARGVSGLFLLNGAVVGSLGSLCGVPLGLGLAFALDPLEKRIAAWTGFHLFNPKIYFLDGVPSEVNPATIGGVVAATLFVSLAFSVYPAWKAARLNPIEAIRLE